MDYKYKIMIMLTLYSLFIGVVAFSIARAYVNSLKELNTFEFTFAPYVCQFLAILPLAVCAWSNAFVEFLQLN